MTSPDSPLERYARVAAALADPFAVRSTVLAGAGLDETTWRALQAQWTEAFRAAAASDDGRLVDEFRAAFAAARAALIAAPVPQPAASSSSVPAEAPQGVDGTALATPVVRAALPFGGEAAAPPPIAAEEAGDRDDVDGTALLDADALGDLGDTLPFGDASGTKAHE